MIKETQFGKTLDQEVITLYTLTNSNGMSASVTDYGAILVSLLVPDKNGKADDVVLGYDRAKDYFINGSCFGATIGPVANRTAGATFKLEGTIYNLLINDNDNNLHSDTDRGLHKTMWKGQKDEEKNSVTFRVSSKDGWLGFPGNRDFEVTYTLTEDNELSIHYHATTDKTTLINMTNHSYFNLKGEGSGKTVEDAVVWLKASGYTPVVTGAIPTGQIAPVAGTPFDFTKEKAVSQDIGADNAQLALVRGYDHNFAVDGYEKGKVQMIAKLSDPETGRCMEVYSDLPGVQLYTGNNMAAELGKDDHLYPWRGGICFETQYFPNSANEPAFECPVVTKDEPYDTTTVYKFV